MNNNILLILFTVPLLLGCGTEENEPEEREQNTEVAAEMNIDIIVAVGKVKPENDIVTLSAPTGGIVRAVFKKDGEEIQPGELVLQLDDEVEQRKIEEIKTQIQSQRSQIAIEQTQQREAEINLANQQSLLAKTKRLLESGAETEQTFADLSTETWVLEVSVERLQAKIQLAVNRLNELRSQLNTAETEAQKKQFTSPFGGTLLDLQVNQGEAVNQFATYAEFAPRGNLIVRAEVDELFSAKVKVGQRVEIVYRGSDEVMAVGEVDLVSPYLKKKSLFSEKPNDQEDRRVREIRIALEDAGSLIINAKVECKIKV